uniref:Glutathione S-transferase C-terminal domain-containing protein n=1 Tax=Salix viminalis TaxID=40686 RepID=A0A6N2KUT9_SALVM
MDEWKYSMAEEIKVFRSHQQEPFTLAIQSDPQEGLACPHGKVICESLVILEYIDETWKQNPLLPEDPHQKANARFWAKFGDDKEGKEQEEGFAASMENLKYLEEEIRGKKFFGGKTIGLADIALGWLAYYLDIFEEIVGLKLIDQENFHPAHGSRNLQMLRSSVRTGRTETSWLPSLLSMHRSKSPLIVIPAIVSFLLLKQYRDQIEIPLDGQTPESFNSEHSHQLHGLAACGGGDGAVECFAMRTKSSIGRIDAVEHGGDINEATLSLYSCI